MYVHVYLDGTLLAPNTICLYAYIILVCVCVCVCERFVP